MEGITNVMQWTPLYCGSTSVRTRRTRDQAPSAPITRSKVCASWLSKLIVQRFWTDGSIDRTLWFHFIRSEGNDDIRRSVSKVRSISGRCSPKPPLFSEKQTRPVLSVIIMSSLFGRVSCWNSPYKPAACNARRPDSVWRSREPEIADVTGPDRKSKMVNGILAWWRRLARVRPPGPAPTIAMEGIILETLVEYLKPLVLVIVVTFW